MHYDQNISIYINECYIATHGTGHGFTNLAALVTKLKFVSGSGEVSNHFIAKILYTASVISLQYTAAYDMHQ